MQKYLYGMIQVAEELPQVKFLAYTKNNQIHFPTLPDNLMIRFSMWNGWDNGTTLKTYSWIEDDKRLPKNCYNCPKDCRKCHFCWTVKKDVVFCKH